jgi:hypothetical protein
MKKILFTVVWMIVFFLIGFVVFGAFAVTMAQTFHAPAAAALDYWKVRLIMVVDWLAPIGLPILALMLGIFGKLPGTRSRNPLAQP